MPKDSGCRTPRQSRDRKAVAVDAKSARSIWVRPLQRLFIDGTPASDVHVLALADQNRIRHHLCALALTKKRRLILWPPMPKNARAGGPFAPNGFVDHVTLELDNRKTHTTSFREDGSRDHSRARRSVVPIENTDLYLWSALGVRKTVLSDQPTKVRLQVPRQRADAAHVTAGFTEFARSQRMLRLMLPPEHEASSCYLVLFYVALDESAPRSKVVLPIRVFTHWLRGAARPLECSVAMSRVAIGSLRLVIFVACPRAELIHDVCFEAGPSLFRAGARG